MDKMNSAALVLTVGWWLASGPPRPQTGIAPQTAAVQQGPQSNAPPGAVAAGTPPAPAPKPCPATSSSALAAKPDCKPARKNKKPRATAATPTSGPREPNKKVVLNGSTADPTVDIAPDVSQPQASQQRDTTNRLLEMTAGNLKIVESRQLNPGQKETVEQIHNYVDQSNAAAKDGDVQRAYTLANKARMLSGDLVKH